ncbi:MAG: hypothetical protein GX289_00430 [Tissierellia bacterium]|nr:hypothetical protein [Tissierellia bacterium]
MGVNKKVTLILMVTCFILGIVLDSFLGPVVKVNHLSKFETIVQEISKNKTMEENTETVKKLLNEMYIRANDYDFMASAFYNELVYIENVFESTDYEKYAESNALKGFMKDLKKNGLILKYDLLAGYIVTPDLNDIADKYCNIIDDDTREYIEFRAYELSNHLYSLELETIDIDEVVKRIDILAERVKKQTEFTETYKELLDYYYDILKGDTHNYFINYDNVELTDYAREKFKTYSEREDRVGETVRDILENGFADWYYE